jgi:hypothetical protein
VAHRHGVAVIKKPFVLTCTGIVCWTLRGKVRIYEHSY